MSKQIKRAGVDIGYCRVKGVTGNRESDRFSFLSVVGELFSSFGLSDADGLQFETPPVIVGETAAKFSGFDVRMENRDWYFSEPYKHLLYAALSQVTGVSADVLLVTGLPAKFWKSDCQDVEKVLTGEHTFKRRGKKTQTVNVKSKITMQGFGALFNRLMNDRGEITLDERTALAPMGVIDAGSKTTNLLSILELTSKPEESDSFQRGGWDIVASLKELLIDRYRDLDLSDFEAETILREKSMVYHGRRLNLTDEVNAAIQKFTAQILGFVSQKWKNVGKMEMILLTGGCTFLIGDAMRKAYPQLVVDADPIYSNAIGYYKYSQRLEA